MDIVDAAEEARVKKKGWGGVKGESAAPLPQMRRYWGLAEKKALVDAAEEARLKKQPRCSC